MALGTPAKVAIGCAIVPVLGCTVACLVMGVWANLGHEGGVRYANDAESYAVAIMEREHLVAADEHMLAYYDESMSADGSTLAILTDQRMVYFVNGASTAIPLASVVDVTSADDGMIGTRVVVRSATSMISFIVAPLNGGEGFATMIESTWRSVRPDVATGTPLGADAGDGASADAGTPVDEDAAH